MEEHKNEELIELRQLVAEMPSKELLTALAKAQGEFPSIEKSRTARVGSYSYKYADLSDIMKSVRPVLAKYDLSVSQETDGDVLKTTVFHGSSASKLCSVVPMVVANGTGPQAMGSTLTYSRRYGLCLLLAIVAEEDDDAQMAQNSNRPNSEQPRQQKAASSATKPVGNMDYAKTNPGWEKEPATEQQRKRLWAMAKEAGYDAAQIQDAIATAFNKESSKDLTKGEVQQLFKELESSIKKHGKKA